MTDMPNTPDLQRMNSPTSPDSGTTSSRNWSDLDLEAFHDHALDADTHDHLSKSLRTDPALRERLASLRSREAAILEALKLTSSVGARAPQPNWRLTRVPHAALLAAALLLTAGVGLIVHTRGTPPQAPQSPSRPHHTALAPASLSPGARILMSMPLSKEVQIRLAQRAPLQSPNAPATQISDMPASDSDDLREFTLALSSERPEAAAVLLESLPAGAQAHAMDALGESIRSAEVARRALDTLTLEHQLAACERWATDARLRPVAFDRLRELQSKATLAPQYERTIRLLEQDASLDGWIASYGLARAR